MSLSQRLGELIAAAFTGIWIQSFEHADALGEIAQLCRDRKWTLASWDVERGLLSGNQVLAPSADPLAAIRALPSLAQPEGSALLVLVNFHRYLQSPEIIQALAHQLQQGKASRCFILILSPVVAIPIELEKAFVTLEHELPDRTQLQAIARSLATEAGELPQGTELEKLLDAAAGLTRLEAENAFSLSLVRHNRLQPQSIWELKSSTLKNSGLLSLYRGAESFADLGGLEALKSFCLRALSARKSRARARGLLLLSPPGCGKSAFCRALGNEIGRPTLILDIAGLYGSLVGQTESNIRQALRIADAMAPVVTYVDEAEKALSGATASASDSGVGSRLFGTLLTYLSDHASDNFVILTANDISRLPPELSRAERFDGIFYLDLPSSAEKAKIWPIHLKRYGLDEKQKLPEDRDWTGAEIQSCCRLAALLDLPLKEAAKNVVPVAVTAAEAIAHLRGWASGRCLDASRGGIYRSSEGASPGLRRVARASAN